jgi:hypothetical protein
MPRNAYLQQAGFSFADRRLLQIRIDANLPPRTFHDDTQKLTSDAPLAASISIGGLAVSGRVVNEKGGAVAGAEIILVPTEPALRLRKDRYGITYSDASEPSSYQGCFRKLYSIFL